MKIKVLHVLTRLNVGGTSRFFEEFFKHANFDEFDYTLLIGQCQNNEVEFDLARIQGATIIRVANMQRKISPVNDFLSLLLLVQNIRKINPDIVHTHTSKAGVIGRISALLSIRQIVLVHSYHGNIFEEYFSSVISRIFVFIERVLSKHTDLLVAISTQVKEEMLDFRIGKAEEWNVINLGISLGEFPVLSHRESRKIASLLWVGRFEEVKNPILAIEALRMISLKYPVHLTMVGDGTLLPAAIEMARADNLPVTFTGWLDNPFLRFANSDFLFVTSKSEGFGYVLLEAALAGIPIISTEVGGIKDFVSDGITGFFAEQEASAFYEVFENAYLNGHKVEAVVANARELLTKSFSSQIMVKKYEDSYKEILASHIK